MTANSTDTIPSNLVAGFDSSTQSCKLVIVDRITGKTVREGRADHPKGTQVNPQYWWEAMQEAIAQAGGINDVAALSVGGQQHGMVVMDSDGKVIRDALLWNDTRSAQAAKDLVEERDPAFWAHETGSVPVASYTVTKLRWLADNEPHHAARVAAVALPHDWLTWRLAGYGPRGESPLGPDFSKLTTDRSDASGTGYFNSVTNQYNYAILNQALVGKDGFNRGEKRDNLPVLPRVAKPNEAVGTVYNTNITLGPGAGDNAAAALGLGLQPGDVTVSIGTSGVICAVTDTPTHDSTGMVSGFADATGRFLPLTATLNAARVLEGATVMLQIDFAELDKLALSCPEGADGLTLVPYLEGERTPNFPQATGTYYGVTLQTMTPQHVARATVEGMLCGLRAGLQAIAEITGQPKRGRLIGGGAKSKAVAAIAPSIFEIPMVLPSAQEFVAIGAAKQAAWVVSGNENPPRWDDVGEIEIPFLTRSTAIEQYKKHAAKYHNS